MRPIIGVIPLWNSTKNNWWMRTNYMTSIEAAGGIPVMLPLTSNVDVLRQIATQFDGFLFTGGHDIDPSLYNEEMLPECTTLCPARDSMESILFKEIFPLDKPIFGICRGLQLFNVLLGGSLYQDLITQHETTTDHRAQIPYDRAVHKVSIIPSTPFSEIIPCEEMGVNSRHHQAIKVLAPSLKVGAISDDGLIEAVYIPEKKFFLATQWHPELPLETEMYSANLFKAFVDACK